VVIHKGKEAEWDEMGSFVGSKKQSWWRWKALDHQTGRMVVYTFGRRADQALLKLKAVLEPFGIYHFIPTAGGLSAESRSATPCGWQAEDATAGPEAPDAAHADQPFSEKNHLLL
jgi:hypothetical protein